MENFSYHVPFYVVTGGVKTQGHSSELNSGQVGLYDRATWSVATAAGNGKEFFFAQGSTGGIDWHGLPVTESHKSPFFYARDVENMYMSRPVKLQNEEWVIGFNGSTSSVGLTYEENKPVRIKFLFKGQPTYRFFGNPKEYVVSYTPPSDCAVPCADGDCPDPIVDCLVHTQAIIDKINTHTELQKFGVQAKLVNAPFTAATTTMTKYCLSLCDNGDYLALEAVKAQVVPGTKVERTARDGSTSTYQFCQPNAASAPADFTQRGSVLQAVCGTCPAGSALSVGRDVYLVKRPLAGTEDLSTDSAKQTYANTIGTAYGVHTFDGATAVDPTTNGITLTAHGIPTGAKVKYNNGGGTTIVGLTNNADYYAVATDANTVKLATTYANALAGTVVDITADGAGAAHTLTENAVSTFIGQDNGQAIVRVSYFAGSKIDAIAADTLTFSNNEPAVCTFTNPSPVAWTTCGTGINSSRTLRINSLNRPNCAPSGDRLADLRSILAGVQGIDLTTLTKIAGVGCVDDYTVQQSSVDCLPEDCLTNNVTFTYDDLTSYEGSAWEVVPPVVTENSSRKCGIRVTAGYIDPKSDTCSFDIKSYWEQDPVKFEISLLGEDSDVCDVKKWPTVHQSKIGVSSRQTGEWVIREVIMKDSSYLKHMAQFQEDPIMRDKFANNTVNRIDRSAFYNLYYVTFRASYGKSFRKNEQEKFTAVFAFKEGDASELDFKAKIIDVLQGKTDEAVFHIAG